MSGLLVCKSVCVCVCVCVGVCSQRRASVLQWNPEVATQLVVASDDDRSPTLQMWDLRNSSAPLKEFIGHSKVRFRARSKPSQPTARQSQHCGQQAFGINSRRRRYSQECFKRTGLPIDR